MPTTRFLNLPEEKRRRIVDAAVDEISRVPFAEMSINRIIQAAGIPRGSFYQYFADKNDLLNYIMLGYQDAMHEKVVRELKENNGDVFSLVLGVLDFNIEFGTKPENYDFCRNVFMHIQPSHEKDLGFVRFDVERTLETVRPYADLSCFKYTGPRDMVIIIGMLVDLMRRAVSRVFADRTQAPQVREDFVRELEMLKYGILKEEETANG